MAELGTTVYVSNGTKEEITQHLQPKLCLTS